MNHDVAFTKTSAEHDGLPLAPELLSCNGPASILPATKKNFVCLRGPCRWYWERSEPFGDGVHRHRLRFCTYGTESVNLTDGNVLACNRHEPPRLLHRLLRAIGF
jgi:hypothetical protein